MFTLVAWSASQKDGGVLTNIAAVADQTAQTSGNFVYVPSIAPNLIGFVGYGAAKGTGTSATRVEVISPSIRAIAPLQAPVPADTNPGDYTGVHIFEASPVKLTPYEGLESKQNDNAQNAGQQTTVALLSDGPLAAVAGQIFTTRATGSITATVGSWTSGTLTFDDSLPEGQYNIVGMRVEASGGIAARLIIPGFAPRPGCITVTDATKIGHPKFRYGGLGVWGTFDPRVPPQLEILAGASNSSQVVYLDLIKAS